MHYHAHIYWRNPQERLRAVGLRDALAELGCGLGRIADEPIGPHPLPMYQATYDSDIEDAVRGLLQDQDLIVLLHEDTGDDIQDHTTGAQWIGQPLELDLDWLRAYQQQKEINNGIR